MTQQSQYCTYIQDTGTPMFTAALFAKARTWKQPKCLTADEWVMKMYYIHTMEYCSATRRNGTGSFVETRVDAESATQTEVKSEGEKQILDINAYRTVEAEQQYR